MQEYDRVDESQYWWYYQYNTLAFSISRYELTQLMEWVDYINEMYGLEVNPLPSDMIWVQAWKRY